MKPLLPILAAAGLLALAVPASAQNAGQIANVRAGANCPRCNLFQADLSGKVLKGRNLAGARLRQADLSLAEMNRTSFAGGDLRDVNFYGGVFGGASFAGSQPDQRQPGRRLSGRGQFPGGHPDRREPLGGRDGPGRGPDPGPAEPGLRRSVHPFATRAFRAFLPLNFRHYRDLSGAWGSSVPNRNPHGRLS